MFTQCNLPIIFTYLNLGYNLTYIGNRKKNASDRYNFHFFTAVMILTVLIFSINSCSIYLP